MALSDREQELFDQLEKQLQDDDPQLAAVLAPVAVPAVSTRRVVLGVLGALAGLLILLVGVMLLSPTASILVGVLGFVVMGAGMYVALTHRSPGRVVRQGTDGAGVGPS